jgi:hypothetical protein
METAAAMAGDSTPAMGARVIGSRIPRVCNNVFKNDSLAGIVMSETLTNGHDATAGLAADGPNTPARKLRRTSPL